MIESKYRLDLDKIPITVATLSHMVVMCGFHKRFLRYNYSRKFMFLCPCFRECYLLGCLILKDRSVFVVDRR